MVFLMAKRTGTSKEIVKRLTMAKVSSIDILERLQNRHYLDHGIPDAIDLRLASIGAEIWNAAKFGVFQITLKYDLFEAAPKVVRKLEDMNYCVYKTGSNGQNLVYTNVAW